MAPRKQSRKKTKKVHPVIWVLIAFLIAAVVAFGVLAWMGYIFKQPCVDKNSISTVGGSCGKAAGKFCPEGSFCGSDNKCGSNRFIQDPYYSDRTACPPSLEEQIKKADDIPTRKAVAIHSEPSVSSCPDNTCWKWALGKDRTAEDISSLHLRIKDAHKSLNPHPKYEDQNTSHYCCMASKLSHEHTQDEFKQAHASCEDMGYNFYANKDCK